MKKNKDDFLLFLGTAGARFVMITQQRSSGGLWLKYKGTQCIIDPGPGSLLRCLSMKPAVRPEQLNAIILTHKHLDHSGDVNVMIEAMTEGRNRKGAIFAPADCFGKDGVVYSYLEDIVTITRFEPFQKYSLGPIRIETTSLNKHSVQTIGLKFILEGKIISLISDTAYFNDLEPLYDNSDLLIVNTVFYEPQDKYEHLSFPEGLAMVKRMHIGKAVFTHFGRGMLKQLPAVKQLIRKERLQSKIVLAYDGMKIPL